MESGPATKAEQLAKDEDIVKAASDAGMTPLEYAQKVAHLKPEARAAVAQAAAKHAEKEEQDNKAKAAHLNKMKTMAEELQKINISREKAVREAAIAAQEQRKANCKKQGLCVKKRNW